MAPHPTHPHLMRSHMPQPPMPARRILGAGSRARYWRGPIALITGCSLPYRGPDLA